MYVMMKGDGICEGLAVMGRGRDGSLRGEEARREEGRVRSRHFWNPLDNGFDR
jgi:hypothetical protein